MKNNFEKLIKKVAAPLSLSQTDRDGMRSLLQEYAAMKPVRDPAVLQKPQTMFMDTLLAYLRRPMGVVMALLLIFILSSGGVAYAAERTLPGDTLYPIKVDVLEPLQVALATTPEAKASLRMTFAEHRVSEAAILSHEGKLSTSTEAALITNFTINANAAATQVALARTNHPVTADLLTAGFATQLATYGSVLSLLNSSSTNNTSQFQAVLQTQVTSLLETPTNSEVQNATSSNSVPKQKPVLLDKGVLDLRDATDAALNASATIIGTNSSALDASSSAYARSELLRASALAEQGRTLLEQHDEAGASAAFRDSLSITTRLDVLTRAASSLGIPALIPNLTSSETSAAQASTSLENDAHTLPSIPPPSIPTLR